MSEQDDVYFDRSASALNILSDFSNQPDEILKMLQLALNDSLTPEQSMIARLSALELTNVKEITILDRAESWEAVPALSEFAANQSKVFLPC